MTSKSSILRLYGYLISILKKKERIVPLFVQLILAFLSGLFSAYVFLESRRKRKRWRIKRMRRMPPKKLGKKNTALPIKNHKRKEIGFNRKESQSYCCTVSPEEVMNLIVSRRSYYPDGYSGSAVSDEDILKILEAANWGISHANSQPWRYVVFSDVDVLLDRTNEHFKEHQKSIFPWKCYTCYDEFVEEYEKRCLTYWNRCSHIVGIGMKRKTLVKRTNPLWEEISAVATSIQNASLMATSLKVACYWSSWYEPFLSSPECVDFFGLDSKAGDLCMGVLCIGHSAKFGQAKAKREGFNARVTWSSFEGNKPSQEGRTRHKPSQDGRTRHKPSQEGRTPQKPQILSPRGLWI